jgi:hypothetical protein
MNIIECTCPSSFTEHAQGCPLYGIQGQTIQPSFAAPQAKKKIWPAEPAEKGGLYSFTLPTRPEQRLMAMTLETFLEYRAVLERLQHDVTEAKAANIKLFQENQELQRRAGPAPKEERRIITPDRGMLP